VRDRFNEGLELLVQLAEEGNIDRAIEPAIEFPPLANYTVHDALVHAASHNSHHLGQIVTIRQIAGIWPPPNGSWTW
jgi:uncharacterized damage-inducible protein DinB